MLGTRLLSLLGFSMLACKAQSKAVFAHYMVGTVYENHANQDIDDAMAIGLDGFALNVGDPTQDYLRTTLASLFGHAESVGFKLYISLDVYAYGDACYKRGDKTCRGPFDYQWIWDAHKDSSAYYQVNNLPLISTFSSGGFQNNNWTEWKQGLANDMFFMPDFDETSGYYDAAEDWWDYWGPVCDGVFSWESAWPERNGFGGLSAGDVSPDVTVLKGAHAHNKLYMMGLSPVQYKNAYGTNIYRQGDMNLPVRMTNILNMEPQPDFVQVITWNDGPESHYIGNLWYEQNNDSQPYAYANQDSWPHTGWQPLIKTFISAYKNSQVSNEVVPSSDTIVGAMWYETIIRETVSCPANADGLNYSKPDGFDKGSNALFWSVILDPNAGAGWTIETVEGGVVSKTESLTGGMNYGAGKTDLVAGAQMIQVKNPSGDIMYHATGGLCVSNGCPDKIYNMNYQVIGLVSGSAPVATCTAIDDDSTGGETVPENGGIPKPDPDKLCIVYDNIAKQNALGVQCQKVCGAAVAAAVDSDGVGSFDCIAIGFDAADWLYDSDGDKYYVSNCTCNNGLIDDLAETFLEALPEIAEIGCVLIMDSFKLIVEDGIKAVPGIDEAIDGGMIALMQASRLARYTYKGIEHAWSAFMHWATEAACGTTYLPTDFQKVFDVLEAIGDAAIPDKTKPKWKQGLGVAGDIGDPDSSKPDGPDSECSSSIRRLRLRADCFWLPTPNTLPDLVNKDDIPATTICTAYNGVNYYTEDAVNAAYKQALGFFNTGMKSTTDYYPHPFAPTDGVDDVTWTASQCDDRVVWEFPILRTGGLLNVGPNVSPSEGGVGDDRILFAFTATGDPYFCGLMTSSSSDSFRSC